MCRNTITIKVHKTNMMTRNYVAKHLHKSCRASVEQSKKDSMLRQVELREADQNASESLVGGVQRMNELNFDISEEDV